ncbi:Protein PLASTID REDOX INSENSITIVE 2, chloroplastic [Ancistrocladus abbreviatus]
MAWSTIAPRLSNLTLGTSSSFPSPPPPFHRRSSVFPPYPDIRCVRFIQHYSLHESKRKTADPSSTFPSYTISHSLRKQICRRAAAEYKFPDPIPEFAEAETQKFRTHLLKKLSKKDIFGDSLEEVVAICTEIFNTFLHAEYGGPGTLLVIPFIDMADTLNERGLPGGPQAARAAVKWAQNNVDKDWKEWTGGNNK